MAIQDFINQHNGKPLDFDGAYGPQCVDLVQFWSQAIGGPRFSGNAKDLVGQTLDFYQWIENTPGAVPQPGDIMVWDSRIGPYGHTSVFVDGNTNSFDSFDQNWNYHPYCEMIHHTYYGVAGWLHQPTNQGEQDMPSLTTKEDAQSLYSELLGRGGSDAELQDWTNINWPDAFYKIAQTQEGQDFTNFVRDAQANYQKTKDSLADANAKVAQLQKQLSQVPPPDPNSITVTKDGLWAKIKSFFSS